MNKVSVKSLKSSKPIYRRMGFRISIICIVFIGVVFLWPSPCYDLPNVHPELRALQKPYKKVTPTFFLDGGSVGVSIVDANDKQLKLALTIYSNQNAQAKFQDLWIGDTYAHRGSSVKVPFTEDSKQFIIEMVQRYGDDQSNTDIVLLTLRANPRDYAFAFTHLLWNAVQRK
jgi:hypothetical protein